MICNRMELFLVKFDCNSVAIVVRFFFENVCKGTIAPCRWAETGDFFHFASEKEGVC